MEAEKCVICGKVIPEGMQVCPDCVEIMEREPQGEAGVKTRKAGSIPARRIAGK